MQDDPAIERIRAVRHRISEECEHDPKKLVAYYLKRQQEREQQQEDRDKAMAAEEEA